MRQRSYSSELSDRVLELDPCRWMITVINGRTLRVNTLWRNQFNATQLAHSVIRHSLKPCYTMATCCPDEQHVARQQVALSVYILPVSRQHNYYSFMSRSTCIPLYPATDGQQTGDSFVADTQATCWQRQDTRCRQHVAGQLVALV